MRLHKYGIEEEQSDIRAHVSLPGRRITVYRTVDMVALVKSGNYIVKDATQPGVGHVTGRGPVVPIGDILPQAVVTSDAFPWEDYCHWEMGCKEKGEMAVWAVKGAILANRFPLWVCGKVSERELDIKGTDIVVSAKRRIQVKYDALACPIEDGGSGNLYIQTHECNPLGIH